MAYWGVNKEVGQKTHTEEVRRTLGYRHNYSAAVKREDWHQGARACFVGGDHQGQETLVSGGVHKKRVPSKDGQVFHDACGRTEAELQFASEAECVVDFDDHCPYSMTEGGLSCQTEIALWETPHSLL